MAWWGEEMGFDPDMEFEADEVGETFDEPWRGPFMDQSSWEQFRRCGRCVRALHPLSVVSTVIWQEG